jgi:hypothetical protein
MNTRSNGGKLEKILSSGRLLVQKGRRRLTRSCMSSREVQINFMTNGLSRKNVGGTTTGSSNTTPEELANELKTFDMKIHKAQIQMVREMSSKLRNYGIPFFGTKSDLVIPFGKEEVTSGDGGRKLENGMIYEAECKSSYFLRPDLSWFESKPSAPRSPA